MRKEGSRTLILVAAATTCLLLLLLLYDNTAPLDIWKVQFSRLLGGLNYASSNNSIEKGDSLEFALRRLVRGKQRSNLDDNRVTCVADPDMCVVKTAVRINTGGHIIYVHQPNMQRMVVHPYTDKLAFNLVSQVDLRGDSDDPPPCQVSHPVPAVVFSAGGFSSNLFHDFNNVILPLFITCRHFQSRVIFVITDLNNPWWVRKFHRILTHLSDYEIIDSAKDGRVHCFPGVVIGLKYHGNLECNSTDNPGGYSIFDFKSFLRNSLSLHRRETKENDKPVLVLISRTKSRRILNEDGLIRVAKELGFAVTLASPQRMSNLNKFAKEVNSCSVLVGAHGAGLTNALFMSAGAVLVQVVPWGLDWPSSAYYGEPAREMGIHYLEYRISPEESSLYYEYPHDHPVITDPASVHAQGYNISRAVYIDGQNLRLNLLQFRETLRQAMQLLQRTTR